MNGTGKRLEKVIDALNMSKTKFAESLGRKAQNLNIYFNGTNEVGYKTLNEIKKLYPQVNIDFIKTGKGEMLLNSGVSVLELHNKDDTEKEFLKKENEFLKSKVDFLESEIVKLKEMLLREVGEFVSTKGQINSIVKKNNRNNNGK